MGTLTLDRVRRSVWPFYLNGKMIGTPSSSRCGRSHASFTRTSSRLRTRTAVAGVRTDWTTQSADVVTVAVGAVAVVTPLLSFHLRHGEHPLLPPLLRGGSCLFAKTNEWPAHVMINEDKG
jgi:hypothetical protein